MHYVEYFYGKNTNLATAASYNLSTAKMRGAYHDTAFGGPLVRNILSALLLCNSAVNGSRGREKRRAVLRRKGDRNAIRARKVALAVDTLVPFTGGGHDGPRGPSHDPGRLADRTAPADHQLGEDVARCIAG